MSLLVSARSFSSNAISSLAIRSLISKYAGLNIGQTLVFNGVDMAVNAVSSYLFNKYFTSEFESEFAPVVKIIASRAIAVSSGIMITSLTMGNIPLGTAVALNYVSVIAGLILRGIEIHVTEEAPNEGLYVFA